MKEVEYDVHQKISDKGVVYCIVPHQGKPWSFYAETLDDILDRILYIYAYLAESEDDFAECDWEEFPDELKEKIKEGYPIYWITTMHMDYYTNKFDPVDIAEQELAYDEHCIHKLRGDKEGFYEDLDILRHSAIHQKHAVIASLETIGETYFPEGA